MLKVTQEEIETLNRQTVSRKIAIIFHKLPDEVWMVSLKNSPRYLKTDES